MLPIHQIERFSASIAYELFVQKEYLCLPNFLISGGNVFEEGNCTTFIVYRIYGWDVFSHSYALLLFDAKANPSVGVWQDDKLTIYQEVPTGYLRLSYTVTTKEKPSHQFLLGKSKQYKFTVDLSSNGVIWKRYTNGEYGCF